MLCFPMFPERSRSRKNYSEFIRQVAGNTSPEKSFDVFLTETYLCKNGVRNRAIVQWICTISPSGHPPDRKVLGNAIVFMHSGNHQESDPSDFAEAVFALFSYGSGTFPVMSPTKGNPSRKHRKTKPNWKLSGISNNTFS